jgi:hypothetical protein
MSLQLCAQTINKVEYFVDTDPGFGNGTDVPVTAGANISDLLVAVDITSLSAGFHNVYLRSKNDAGVWSITNRWMFVKAVAATNVNKLEFFVDTDPGFGNAANVSITPGINVANVAIPIDISSLSAGFHNIYLRSKDDAGVWSLTNRWMFVKDIASVNTNKLEYFVDTDPGFGNGTNVTITPGSNVANVAIPIDISSLSAGFHNIYLRSKDDAGVWSLTNRWMFVKDIASVNTNKLEYFIDTDPGFGNGTNVTITPGSNVANVAIPIDISSLSTGFHNIYLRSKDDAGKWGITNRWLFFKDIAKDNFYGGEYFFDTDPGFGNGTAIPFGGGLGTNVSDFSFVASINSLPNGLHYLFIRTKELNGKWSLTNVIQFDKQVPLPITLLYFTARADGKRSLLNWETATEINNDRFEIERSPDGISFSKIDQVPGAGNSSIHISYQWYDNDPLKGNNYYRLKQVDIDGKFTHSPTRQVNFKDNNYFSISNNPTNGTPLIIKTTELNSTISIFDESGRKLKELHIQSNSFLLSVDQFANGIYLLVMHKDGAVKVTEKFVVKR